MKNLVVLNLGLIKPESRTYPDLELVDSVFDTISDSITFVMTSEASGVIEVQQYMNSGQINLLASFLCSGSKLLLFSHFVDSSVLVFAFENGDIITATYNLEEPSEETTVVEIVGTIDDGLLTASWSSDEETLVLLSLANKLIILSREFEPINEKTLNPDDIRISDSNHVSVGWGKKETQFKGKGAKALEREKEALKHAGLDLKENTVLKDPTVNEIEKGYSTDFDDGHAIISWRGDCEYFAVSTLEPTTIEDTSEQYNRRVIRVFSREGELNSVAEAVDGLENTLSWKPQGSLIASTQRFTDEEGEEVLSVVFFERNGLRHGEFNTRLNPNLEKLYALAWSSNSGVLAFHLKDRVQFWMSKNYHWYLKQEIFVNGEDALNGVSYVKFHPEKPFHVMIGTLKGGIQIVNLASKIVSGPTYRDLDIGMTLVTDGSSILITPFGIANVPPPMSYREIGLTANINDLCVNKSNDSFTSITSDRQLVIVRLASFNCCIKQPVIIGTCDLGAYTSMNDFLKQVAFIDNDIVCVCVDDNSFSRLLFFDVNQENGIIFKDEIIMESKVASICSLSNYQYLGLQTIDGSVSALNRSLEISLVSKLPQVCQSILISSVSIDDTVTLNAIGLSSNGKLYINDKQTASGVTSMRVTESHLLFTTAQTQLCFIHLNSSFENEVEIFKNFKQEGDLFINERVRQIERGLILVSVIPSRCSVVLQAPRGNLETIYPRMLVVSEVREFLKNKNYGDAFKVCRTHRIDLDILYDYDPNQFLKNTELFINQIKKVDYLDLFVSCLREEDTTVTKYQDTADKRASIDDAIRTLDIRASDSSRLENNMGNRKVLRFKEVSQAPKESKVSKICEALLNILLTPKYIDIYLQTILTAYACQKPPKMEEALQLIRKFDDSEKLDQCVTHLCFLLDVSKLYTTALGLYDVKLALQFAQKSQMDPKEYLPFLQNLHVKPKLRKQFLIDDFLKRYEKALQQLHDMGEDALATEFNEYVVAHNLYKAALSIYKYNDSKSDEILLLYANYLFSSADYTDAALTFEYLGLLDKALESYILAKRWKESLAIVEKPTFSNLLTETADRLIQALTDEHKYADAAEISYRFLNNVEEAVILYCKSYDFDDAIVLAVQSRKENLLESSVDEQLSEAFGTIAELLADCRGQVVSQVRRLREIREKKSIDPNSFYGMPNDLDVPDDVSVAASETSTTPSFFTRYTGKTAGTAKTGASRRTVKNRKREERKRAKGRKGTIYEEEYLIGSVTRLVERLDRTQPEATKLIDGLMRRRMKEQAFQIQKNWCEVVDLLNTHVEEIYNVSEKDRERIDENGDLYLIPEFPKPKINPFPVKAFLDYSR